MPSGRSASATGSSTGWGHELADLVRGLENVAKGLTVESEAQFIEPYMRLHTHRCLGGVLVNLGIALTAEEDDPDFVELQERLEENDWEQDALGKADVHHQPVVVVDGPQRVVGELVAGDIHLMIHRFREMAARFPVR